MSLMTLPSIFLYSKIVHRQHFNIAQFNTVFLCTVQLSNRKCLNCDVRFLVLDFLPFPTLKLPKLKKLRQWSQDSLANLSQLTSRNSNNVNPKLKTRSSCDVSVFPTNGISTISSAIREQKIDPKRDNFGLYALKCDRSSSVANARRGILLNLPSTIVKTKAEINNFQSMERNHEVFQSCEKIVDSSTGIMYDGATSSSGASGAENKVKIQPPPRKKKRQTATRQIVAQQKQTKKPTVVVKQANQNVLKTESLEKNESGLYRIVGATSETAKQTLEEPRKKEHVVTMVKPKVQKAVAVKTKPVQQQVAKVKSYEWNKHQRKASVGNVSVKPHFTKRYLANENTGGSFKSESSVDIFQSNKLKDQKKLFDEFDALFDKSKEFPDLSEVTPMTALNKLNALKFPSSSHLDKNEAEVKIHPQVVGVAVIPSKPLSVNLKTKDFPQKVLSRPSPTLKSAEVSSKPKIVFEQPKVPNGIIKKKILYYDDEHEFQQLIMNQTQSTTIINNHYSATLLPQSTTAGRPNDDGNEGSVPISCSSHSVANATGGLFDSNGNLEDYQSSSRNIPKARETSSISNNNSNSLRIFSNDGVFVFNL